MQKRNYDKKSINHFSNYEPTNMIFKYTIPVGIFNECIIRSNKLKTLDAKEISVEKFNKQQNCTSKTNYYQSYKAVNNSKCVEIDLKDYDINVVEYECEDKISKRKICYEINKNNYNELLPKKWLGDQIVNFYVDYCINELNESKYSYFNFTHVFYNKLVEKNNINDFLLPSFSSKQVSNWIKKVNKMERDFLILPIINNNHWYCVVIAYPYKITNLYNYWKNKTEIKSSDLPLVIYCDSIFDNNDVAIQISKKYLFYEFLKHNKIIHEQINFISDCFDMIPSIIPNVSLLFNLISCLNKKISMIAEYLC